MTPIIIKMIMAIPLHPEPKVSINPSPLFLKIRPKIKRRNKNPIAPIINSILFIIHVIHRITYLLNIESRFRLD